MTANRDPKGSHTIRKAWERFCGLLLFLAITINMAEIVLRVAFRLSIDLFFDFPVWLTVWSLLLISGLLLPSGEHISIDFIRIKIRGRARWLLEVSVALTTMAFSAFVTWGGILFLQQLHMRQAVYPRSIPIPMWMVQLCLPLGMGLFTAFALVVFVRAVRKRW